MIHNASKLIAEKFDQVGIKYGNQIQEHDDGSSSVNAGFIIKNGSDVLVSFISHDEDNDVAVRAYRILSLSEENRSKMLEVLNQTNLNCRYAKFYLDDDGDINAMYDFPAALSDDLIGEIAKEIFIRFAHIIDEAYPNFMRTLWG